MSEFIIQNGVLKRYTGPGGAVVVPEGVTTIADGFFLCRSVETLVLPETVTVIEPAAFYVCESLREITLPRSLQTIGGTAFVGCKSLKHITIPGSVEEIESRTFVGCGLETVTIEQGVQLIGDGAFMNCHKLREITIPEGVKSIGYRAFFGSALQTVMLPISVTRLGSNVFEECEALWLLLAPGVPLEKLQAQDLTLQAAMGYLCRPDFFARSKYLEEYNRCIVAKKKTLVARLVQADRVEGLQTYASLGKITARNFEPDFLQPALDAQATQCVAFLMNWRNDNISPEQMRRSRDWKL